MKHLKIWAFVSSIMPFLYTGCEDTDPIDNTRAYFSGRILDLNDEPIDDQEISIEQDFERGMATLRSDSEGFFQGAGFVYSGEFKLILPEKENLTYHLDYSQGIAGRSIELPEVNYEEDAIMIIEIVNNSGNELALDFNYTSGWCDKFFIDNVEQLQSSCYEQIDSNRTLNTDFKEYRFSVLKESILDLQISDGVNTRVFNIQNNQPIQSESIIIN